MAKHENNESKAKEKKEKMARKIFVSGKGDKQVIKNGLEHFSKNSKLRGYSEGRHGDIRKYS